MEEKNQIDWHKIIQDILDEHLPFMSGKRIKEAAREYPKYFMVDYYCLAEDRILEDDEKDMVRPFDHLKEKNIIEYKSIHKVLNERTFREYAGRALLLEGPEEEENYQGRMTLTILISHKPQTLLGMKEYKIEKLNDWKYCSHWLKDLEIYILVQRGMRKKKEGEALALLQVLEGEKEKQPECWTELLSQNLRNADLIRQIIGKIDMEVFMNVIAEVKQQGRIEGQREGEIKGKIEGKIEGIETILEIKFGARGLACMEKIRSLQNLDKLTKIFHLAKKAPGINEFESGLSEL